jgi:hypothetical protein
MRAELAMMFRSDSGDDDALTVTLSVLRSECELCGAWSPFTGRTQTKDGRTGAVVRCPNGDGEFPVWRKDREPVLAAYERARATLRDPVAYERAFATLTSGDGAAIASLVSSPPPELPLFGIEDVALQAEAVARWCELLLDGDGWLPAPARSVRIEEVIATAVACDAPACVTLLIGRASPDEVRAAIPKVERRFWNRAPTALAPLLPILEGRRPPDAQDLRAIAEPRSGARAGSRRARRRWPGST